MKKIYTLTISFLLIQSYLLAQGTICRTSTIDGTSKLERLGKRIVGYTNTYLDYFDQMMVYITYQDNGLYHFYKEFLPQTGLSVPQGTPIDEILEYFDKEAHSDIRDTYILYKNRFTSIYIYSNYQTYGADFSTKILYNVDEIGLDLYEYCRNLVFHNQGYPETFERSSKLEEAIKNQISFFVDNRIFAHPKLKSFDLRGAESVKLVNKYGSIIPNGFDILLSQKELKKLNLYKGEIDGLDGPGTQGAISAYKNEIGLNKLDNVNIELSENKHKVSFEDSDDFIRYFDEEKFICEAEFCATDDEATISGNCPFGSIEFSSKGKIIVTIMQGPNSIDFTIVDGKKEQSTSDCSIERKACFGKKAKRSYNFKCGNQSLELSSDGIVKLTSGNISTTF
ncbi:MAG: hypothetical protein ABJO02_10380 [Reichenbachiella sp.]|uniref:hypothetical protein n=1 Tax=Reichenbachiella sp. TaxID=2184521 RepID=UPI0032973B6B